MHQNKEIMNKNKTILSEKFAIRNLRSTKSKSSTFICQKLKFIVFTCGFLSRELKQKNEGGWDFYWDEESKPGHIVLEVKIAKFLDSSLIDVDVHPTYVSMIIKSKVLRLRLPAEVKVAESKCQRSKTSGSLLIIMPKVIRILEGILLFCALIFFF